MKNEKEEKIIIKKKNKKQIIKQITLAIVVILVLCSLCLSAPIEGILKLQPSLSMLAPDDVELHFIDVGQGDAIAIRFPNDQTMLIDSGPQSHKKILFTYLDKVFFYKKEKCFDYVFLTHSDNDHCGNMLDILKRYKVDLFCRPNIGTGNEKDEFDLVTYQNDYEEIINYAQQKQITTIVSTFGQTFNMGGVNLSVVGPVTCYDTTNAQSTVLYLEYKGYTSLLLGDAEYPQLIDVLNTTSTIQKIDILKIGHHGSANSLVDASSDKSVPPTIFEKINVSNAVISVSANNSYGHPNSMTLTALKSVAVTMQETLYDRTHLTSEEGNILATISNKLVFYSFGKTNDYLFVPYYVIVIMIIAVCIVIAFIPTKTIKTFRQSKNQKI